MSEMQKKIGENIKQARILLGLSQKELATEIGKKSSAYIALVENGKHGITVMDLMKLCEALEVTMDDAIEGVPFRTIPYHYEIPIAIKRNTSLEKDQKRILLGLYKHFTTPSHD